MSKILEICGAPGSGKTTTYNALQSIWRNDFNWSPTDFPEKKINYKNLKYLLKFLRHQKKRRKRFCCLRPGW